MTARIALASCRDLPDWEVDDRPLVEALRARDLEVVEPAWDDPEHDWAANAGCVIRTTWDYHERRDEFCGWARRAHQAAPLFNPPGVVEWNTHKGYLRELEEAGARLTPTVWATRGESVDLARVLDERDWQRGFLKPCVGASASGTLRFDREDVAAAQAHLDGLLAEGDVMIQPYLASVETEGELSAIFVADELAHGVRKVPVPGDYRVQDDYGATDEPYEFTAEEERAARRTLEAASERFGVLLYARADFLRCEDGALGLNELELVEPSLFFRHGPRTADLFADTLLEML